MIKPQSKKLFLKDQAYEMIKKLLMNGDLSPGEFLSEVYLSEQLEMSRTPIRSALQRLEHEGIVRIHPKQGVYICDISIKQVYEVFEIRMVLEIYAVRKLAHTIESTQLEELKSLLKCQFEQMINEDLNASLHYDMLFHLKIMEFIDNQQMYTMFASIKEKLSFFGKKVLTKKVERLKQTYEEHLSILEAIEKKDPEKAARSMEEHLHNGRKTLLDP